MPQYVVSNTQDETQQALDPDGANAKVSFNNGEVSPAQEKSRLNRGKYSTTRLVIQLFYDAMLTYLTYFDGCETSIHSKGVRVFYG